MDSLSQHLSNTALKALTRKLWTRKRTLNMRTRRTERNCHAGHKRPEIITVYSYNFYSLALWPLFCWLQSGFLLSELKAPHTDFPTDRRLAPAAVATLTCTPLHPGPCCQADFSWCPPFSRLSSYLLSTCHCHSFDFKLHVCGIPHFWACEPEGCWGKYQ